MASLPSIVNSIVSSMRETRHPILSQHADSWRPSPRNASLPPSQAFHLPHPNTHQLSRQTNHKSHVKSHPSQPLNSRPPLPKAAAAPPAGAQKLKGWSNPSGSPLRELVPGRVWAAERAFIWFGIDVGGRMAVVRLGDGSIWVHSPVPLDPDLKVEIDKLGPVQHIVSPNYEHCGYAQQWIEAYPEAQSYACPGLREAKPTIPYTDVVGENDEAPDRWNEEFEVAWFDCEHNPFTQTPFFNEVVFCHKPSQSLFVTDLFWNYPQKNETSVPTWLWKQGMDRVYLPFYKTFMLFRRNRFQEQLRRVLGWEWNLIIPCHGYLVSEGAKEILEKHLT